MSRFATDLLRVIAVTFICYNHAAWEVFINVGTKWEDDFSRAIAAVNQLGKPSVLFFLFLSGLAFGAHRHFGPRAISGASSGAASADDFRAGDFFQNRALRILPPFLVISLIGFLLPGVSRADSWGGFALHLLDGGNMFHLYFVALLLYLYLLYPLLRRIDFRWSRALLLAAPLLVLHLVNPHDAPADAWFWTTLAGAGVPEAIAFAESIRAALLGPGQGLLATWLIYAAYGLAFFQYGLWTGAAQRSHFREADAASLRSVDPISQELQNRARVFDEEQSWFGLLQTRLIGFFASPRGRRFALLTLLLPAGFALVYFDFYAAAHRGVHADPAGRIWRPEVALYAAVLILWMTQLPPRASGPLLRRLSRASFLVYLFHPLWMFALKDLGVGFTERVILVIALGWATGLALCWLAARHPVASLLLGEGDRVFAPAAPSAAAIPPEPTDARESAAAAPRETAGALR